ncbi:hypothetical protein RHS03_04782, partial [Rhizoctonia solani]
MVLGINSPAVDRLPVEILAHIFWLVYSSNHRISSSRENEDGNLIEMEFPRQSETISHVCSTWRRVALAEPSLWSHMSIPIDRNVDQQLLACTEAYAQRTCHHPLQIHLYYRENIWMEHPFHAHLAKYGNIRKLKFTEAVVAPIGSRLFDIFMLYDRQVHFSAIEHFLTNCITGTLINYVARVGIPRGQLFIGPNNSETSHGLVNTLGLPESQLESQWRSMKFLDVRGLCILWTSGLYHGLVDFRLGSNVSEMTELELVEILRVCPNLRTLHLMNQIHIPLLRGFPAIEGVPVTLNELEVLNIQDLEGWGIENGEILRWIQPGSRPLQFTYLGTSTETLARFFGRSNVTKFFRRGWDLGTLLEVLRMATRIQTLVLDAFEFEVDTITALVHPVNEEQMIIGPVPVRIDRLYLFGFEKLALADIQEAVNQFSLKELFLWKCHLLCPSKIGPKIYEEVGSIREWLSSIKNCPLVEYLTGDTQPIDPENWK